MLRRWIIFHERTIRNARSFSQLSTQQGNGSPWEVTIGIEVHAQIKSKAKLFSLVLSIGFEGELYRHDIGRHDSIRWRGQLYVTIPVAIRLAHE